jgi:hypothetical protein
MIYKIDVFEIAYIILGFIAGGKTVDFYKKICLENFVYACWLKYKNYLIFNRDNFSLSYNFEHYKMVLDNYKKIIDDAYKDIKKNDYYSPFIENENMLISLTQQRMGCIKEYAKKFTNTRSRDIVIDIICLKWNQPVTFDKEQIGDFRNDIEFNPYVIEGITIEEDFKIFTSNWKVFGTNELLFENYEN